MWVRHRRSRKSSSTHSSQSVCRIFACPNNDMATGVRPGFLIYAQMLMHAIAYGRCCPDAVRESPLEVDWLGEKSLATPGTQTRVISALRLAFHESVSLPCKNWDLELGPRPHPFITILDFQSIDPSGTCWLLTTGRKPEKIVVPNTSCGVAALRSAGHRHPTLVMCVYIQGSMKRTSDTYMYIWAGICVFSSD